MHVKISTWEDLAATEIQDKFAMYDLNNDSIYYIKRNNKSNKYFAFKNSECKRSFVRIVLFFKLNFF